MIYKIVCFFFILKSQSHIESNSNHSETEALKNQILELRKELEASQDLVHKTQKKLNTMKSDYDTLEEELNNTKNALIEMSNGSRDQQYQAEINRIKNNRVFVLKINNN